mmetsp:Transcript_10416/g.38676  ORF Transcript_10416/g.38676 Transcript_10416/m.38676 type:complete len:145 (+) Transcript_10416:4290-4724(+)
MTTQQIVNLHTANKKKLEYNGRVGRSTIGLLGHDLKFVWTQFRCVSVYFHGGQMHKSHTASVWIQKRRLEVVSVGGGGAFYGRLAMFQPTKEEKEHAGQKISSYAHGGKRTLRLRLRDRMMTGQGLMDGVISAPVGFSFRVASG